MRQRIVRNTVFNAVGFAWQGVALLAMVPLIVHYAGIERYGVWVLLVALVAHFDLADLSGGATLTKYIAQYHTLNDQPSLRRILDNGALFYCALALAAVAIGIPLGPPLLQLFDIPPALRPEAHFVFHGVLAVWCVTTVSNAWKSVLTGLQRMDILNGIGIAAVLVKLAGAFYVLHQGYGLRGLVVSELTAACLALVATWLCLLRTYPQLLPRPGGYDARTMKQILGFGARLNVSSLSELINTQFDKILLSRLLGMEYVAWYDIGGRLLKYARSFVLMLVSALAPAVAELDARADAARVKNAYTRSTSCTVFFTLWVMGLLFVTAPSLVHAWVGPGYDAAATTMRILCLGYGMNTLTSVPYVFAIGLGLPGYLMRVALLQTGLNIVLSILLVLAFGYFGAPAGTAAALVLGGIYFIGSFGRLMDESLARYLRHRLLRLVLCALAAGALALATGAALRAVAPPAAEAYRGLAALLLSALVYSVAFTWASLRSDKIVADEWGRLRGRVYGARRG